MSRSISKRDEPAGTQGFGGFKMKETVEITTSGFGATAVSSRP
jgi:hypothetical protein